MEPENSDMEYCERIAFLKQDSTAPDMYKLTYDSDEEVAGDKKRNPAKKKSEAEGRGEASSQPKIELVADKNATTTQLKPNVKRTKDSGYYEGNGRFYSLFANDAFLNEELKQNKKAGCNFKLVLLAVTLFAMTVGILCLIIVVSDLRDRQRTLIQRITSLEKELGVDGEYESLNDNSKLNDHNDQIFSGTSDDCCVATQNSLKVIRAMMNKQTHRVEDIQKRCENTNARFADVLSKYGFVSKDLHNVNEKVFSLASSVRKIQTIAEAAKKLTLLSLKETGVDGTKVEDLVNDLNTKEVIAFNAARAASLSKSQILQDEPSPMNGFSPATKVAFDVSSLDSPSLMFTTDTVGTGKNMHAESGIFHVPIDGEYVLFMSFCIKRGKSTTIHLMKNEAVVRAMKMSSDAANSLSVKQRSPSEIQHNVNDLPSFLNPGGAHHNDEDIAPPLPLFLDANLETSSDAARSIESHQFSEIVKASADDKIYLKIDQGTIVEFVPNNNGGVSDTAQSCTRFSGYRID